MREIRFLRLWIAVQIFCNSGWIDVDPVRMFHVNNFSNGSLIFEWENLFVFAISIWEMTSRLKANEILTGKYDKLV